MGGYGGMGMGGGMMGSQYLMSLNQFLFGIQSVVFSLGQAVQIVGMNAQQIKGLYESVKGMVENALGQVNKLGSMSVEEVMGTSLGVKGEGAKRWMLGEDEAEGDCSTAEGEENILTQSEIIRRRRLAAFRWTVTLATSYCLYRGVRRLIRALIYGGGGEPIIGGICK